ncbi:MAG: isochorismate synthase, partial [Firmicutes bacterium]|nr:isochorismate synthase [Bacillota bacterium]
LRFEVMSGGRASAFGGVAFDPDRQRDLRWKRWPVASLTVPRLLFESDSAGCRLTVNVVVAPGSDTESIVLQCLESVTKAVAGLRSVTEPVSLKDRAVGRSVRAMASGAGGPLQDIEQDLAYERAVTETARDIREGLLRKVVLARRADYPVDERDHLADALATLAREHPDSTVFVWGNQEDVFVGAAPERLIRVADGQVSIDCLAGTAPRSNEVSEDRRLGRELFESAKNQDEHRAVVEGVLMSGADFALDWNVPRAPRLLALGHVQHLYTPLTATLRPDKTVLDAVAALHPTPAVAGTPRDSALAAIAARETMDRGYYAGPVGFVEADGSGEFVVALRCALLGPHGMSLFAGGGIMGGSDPMSERAETEWKMRAIRSAFGLTGSLDHKEGDL